MRKNVAICAALLSASFLCAAPTVAQAKTVQQAKTVRHATTGSIKPLGAAGDYIAPFSTVRAGVDFTDDGTTLTVLGYGVGFNPGLQYTSFFYGTGSVARGALACIPPTPNNLTATQMITAYWLPLSGSTRTLYVAKTGTSYTPLSTVGTFSVRYDSTPTVLLGTVPPTPAQYWLNSCGKIRSSI